MEVTKAYKRLMVRQKKDQEQQDLAPAKTLQPKIRTLRYDDVKSAMAEETVICNVMRDPALFAADKELTGADFSVALFGRVFDQLRKRYAQGLEVSLAVLEDISPEEMSHIAAISHRQEGPANEKAFADCVKTIKASSQVKQISTDDQLMAFRNKLKESKGTK